MRSAIIKSFLPWIVFFAFADGSTLGLKIGAGGSLLCLFLFNRGALQKGFLLDWSTLSFSVLMPIVGITFHQAFVIQHSLLLAQIVLTSICFVSLIISKPVTLQHARLTLDQCYWNIPLLFRVNYWITFFWGSMFLLSGVVIGLYSFGVGTKLWMIEILPTFFLVNAIAFTIVFPDVYHKRMIANSSGIFNILNISPLQQAYFNRISIGYRTMGNGHLIILLQDAYVSMHAWDSDFLKRLAQDFQLLIFDYPGVGYSSFDQMPYTVKSLSDLLYAFIEQLHLKPLALLGVGVGGFIAQNFFVSYPDKVKSLILINTDMGGSKAIRSQIDQQALWCTTSQCLMPLLFPDFVIPRLTDKMSRVFLSDELTGMQSDQQIKRWNQLIVDWYQNEHGLEYLQKLTVSILIIAGFQDVFIPFRNADLLKQSLSGSHLVKYDDAGHGVIYQYPFEIGNHIKSFL
jgi:pimeloyl-ACP methyl ester carboxylesterase